METKTLHLNEINPHGLISVLLKNLWVIECNSGVSYQMAQALPNTKVQGAGNATVASGWRNLPNYYAMRDALGMYYMSWG